jgi:tripartite-type tricarboxylate transporter receptor subunit TctC
MQMGRTRLDALPDVPTAIESGFPDFEALAWWGAFAPKGTPGPVVHRLSDALAATLGEETVARRLRETQQITLLLEGPEKLRTFFAQQVRYWGAVVRANGIRDT